jgi:peptide deformylase
MKAVVLYGDPVLRSEATPISEVTDEIRALARDMLDTMYAHDGAGLAAEQIGRTERICVIDVSPGRGESEGQRSVENPDVSMPLIMINPEITGREGEQRAPEGCLSFPEIFVQVTRSSEVTARFVDETGAERTIHSRGLLARAIQHEIDHLNGVLLVDQMSPVQKVAVSGKLKRIRRQSKRSVL